MSPTANTEKSSTAAMNHSGCYPGPHLAKQLAADRRLATGNLTCRGLVRLLVVKHLVVGVVPPLTAYASRVLPFYFFVAEQVHVRVHVRTITVLRRHFAVNGEGRGHITAVVTYTVNRK